jgi:signal transduction histidine kinase
MRDQHDRLSTGLARGLAWSSVCLHFILSAAGLGLQARAGATYIGQPFAQLVLTSLLAAIWPITGALIVARYPRHPIGWLLCVGLLPGAIELLAAGYAAYDQLVYAGSLPGIQLVLVWSSWGGFPLSTTAFTLLLLLFPDGTLGSPARRRLGRTAIGALLALLPLAALRPRRAVLLGPLVLDNPLGTSPAVWVWLQPLFWAALGLVVLCFPVAFVLLLARLRRAQGDERQQIKWLLLPAGLFCFFALTVIPIAATGNPVMSRWLNTALVLSTVGGIPIASAFAIFRHRLYDVDVVINRALVYGALSACVIGAYALVVGGASLVLQANVQLVGLLITIVLAGSGYRRLRALLQTGADRLVPGHAGVLTTPPENHYRPPRSPALPSAGQNFPTFARWIAWSLVGMFIFLAAVGLILQGVTRAPFGAAWLPAAVILVTLVALWIVTGALIISRHPRHPVGWLLCAGLFWPALDMFSAGYAAYDVYVYAGSLPGMALALVWLKLADLAPLGLVAFTLIVLLFPDGRFPSPGWRKVAWTTVGTLCVFLPLQAVEPRPVYFGFVPFGPNPLAVSLSLWVFLKPLMWTAFYILVLCYGAAIASLLVRLRQSHGDVRQQAKWLLPPVGLYAVFLLLFLVGLAEANDAIVAISIAVGQVAAAGIVIAIAFAIFRYRLYDIDFILNRTLVYGALTAFVLGLYVFLVGGTSLAVQTGGHLAALLMTGVLAGLAYRPLRAVVQRGADRLMPVAALTPAVPPGPASSPSARATSPAAVSGIQARVRRGPLAYLAWVLVAVYFILAGAGLLFGIRAKAAVGQFPIAVFILTMVVIGIWPLIGALIVNRHPRHPVGWLLFAAFPLAALDIFAVGYAAYLTGPLAGVQTVPAPVRIWLTWSAQPFVLVAFTFLNLLFPTGQFITPRWRGVAWLCALTLPVCLALALVEPGPLVLLPGRVNTFAVAAATWGVLGPLNQLATALLLLCGLASVMSLFLRLRQSTGDERQQLKWLLFPAMLYWISQPFGALAKYDASGDFLALGVGLVLISVPLLVIATAFAIFKYRLYDIDVIIHRALVYGALTVCVVALYALTVGALGVLVQTQGNLVITLLATGLVAVLFQPLRERLQRAVNRLTYGSRDEPVAVFARLGALLQATASPQQMLPGLVRTIAETLRLPYAAVELEQGGERQVVAAHGRPGRELARFPLVYQQETIGNLVAAPRSGSVEFGKADRDLLENIASQASAVAHAVQLTQALQRSRARLVTAREEERRRLRRDLHDELGPQLASQTLLVQALERRLGEVPPSAAPLLAELQTQAQQAVTDIRRIVYDLRPPALDELGLLGALREALAPYQRGGARLTLEGPDDLPPLPAAVEVAAYRIVQEAVANVFRHAGATDCRVRLDYQQNHEQTELRLAVEDDGVGLAADRPAGVGLRSMRERAAELGGSLTLQSRPGGGTRVWARLPIVRAGA